MAQWLKLIAWLGTILGIVCMILVHAVSMIGSSSSHLTLTAVTGEGGWRWLHFVDVQRDITLTLPQRYQFQDPYSFSPDGFYMAVFFNNDRLQTPTVRIESLPSQEIIASMELHDPLERYVPRLIDIRDARWSPDSRSVLINNPSLSGIQVVDLQTGMIQQQLEGRSVSFNETVWSPDSQRIAFYADEDIYLTGKRQPMTEGLGLVTFGEWSPDGTQVTFYELIEATAMMRVYRADANTAEREDITGIAIDGYAPLWSPDGAWVAFLSGRIGERTAFVRRLSDGELYELDVGVSDLRSVNWSPDSTQLTVVANFAGDPKITEIYLVEPNGENVRKVTGNGYDPLWSPDGRYLTYYTLVESGLRPSNRLTLFDVQTWESQPLTDHGVAATWPGNELAYVQRFRLNSRLVILDAATGEILYQTPDDQYIYGYSFHK